jgi:processive 1,2-diacylglycerol beta-glucosyltransferase
VEATGIPIDPRFCMAPPRFAMPGAVVRPNVLVSGGGCGLGDLPTVVNGLLRAITDADVTVVCGRNTDLEATMRAFAAAYRPTPGAPALTVIGYTKEMHVLMAAADVIVGKPGGLTTTEARAIGLPMVLLRPIPGQEERNAQMLVSCGAAVRADRPQDAGAATAAILGDPERLWRMRAAASAAGRPRAAFDVASRIDALLRSAPAARGADRLVGRGTA